MNILLYYFIKQWYVHMLNLQILFCVHSVKIPG